MSPLIGVVCKITPTGYVPDEDRGMFMISYALPEGLPATVPFIKWNV